MSRILETLFGWALDVSNFFDGIRARRHDDELTAEYKARQRACVWATVLAGFVMLGAVLVGNFFNTFSDALSHSAPVEALREPLSTVLFVALGASLLYMTYAYLALWRFIKLNRDE